MLSLIDLPQIKYTALKKIGLSDKEIVKELMKDLVWYNKRLSKWNVVKKLNEKLNEYDEWWNKTPKGRNK